MFEALTERDQELAGVITGSHDTFEALAREDDALAESFQILPTFERESRLTFERLDEFQADTRPLIQDLIPVAQDLSPTLRSVRQLSPELRSLFGNLDTLFEVGEDGLPALERTLNGLAPVLDALDPFLGNLDPVLRYLDFQKTTVTDFLAGPGVALAQLGRPGPRAAGCAPLPAPARLPRGRDDRRPRGAAEHEPRQRLPRARRADRASRRPATGSSPTSIAATSTTPRRPPRAPPRPRTRRSTPPTIRRPASRDVGPGFAPCILEGGDGDFPGGFGSGRFPTLFADP